MAEEVDGMYIQLGADGSALASGLDAAIAKLLAFKAQAGAVAKQTGQGFSDLAAELKATGVRAADNFAAGFNTVNSRLTKSFKDLDKQRETLEKGYGRLGQSFSSVGEGLTKYVTAPLTLLAGASIKTAGDIQALEKGFAAVYKGSGDVGAELKKTLEIAKLPGLGLTEAIQGSVRLQAVGISAEQARKTLLAFGNALATTGGGKTELDRVTVQLGQLSAKGKVLSQDLRPIIEAAPAAAAALQKLYGTVDSSDIQAKLEAQGKSSADFIKDLTNELGKLPSVSGGINNALENLADAGTLALSKLGNAINKAFDIGGLADALSAKITEMAESFDQLDPSTQKFILGLAGVVAAAGPVLLVIGGVLTALPNLVAGFGLVTTALEGSGAAALAFATGPVGIAIGAVALLAAGLYYAAGASDRALDSYRDQARETDKLTSSVTPLLNRYEELTAKTNKSAAEQEELRKVIQQLAEQVPGATTAIDAYGNATGISTEKITEFTQALREQKAAQAALNLPAQQAKLEELATKYAVLKKRADEFNRTGSIQVTTIGYDDLGSTVESYGAGSQAVKQLQADLADANVEFQKQKGLVDELTGSVNTLGGAYSQIGDEDLEGLFFGKGGPARIITTLDTLKEKLKALNDLHGQQEVGTKDFYSTKQEIIDLTALIKKYEDTGKAAKKAADQIAKAFADISNKVKAIDVRVNLGTESQYDAAIEKVKELNAGIAKVTDMGVGAGDVRLIGLTKQLTNAKSELTKLLDLLKFKPATAEIKVDLEEQELARIQKDLDDKNYKAKVQFQFDGDDAAYKEALARNQKDAATQVAQSGAVRPSNTQAQFIQGGVKQAERNAFDANSLREYNQALKEIDATQKTLGNTFNEAGAKFQATAKRMGDLVLAGKEATAEYKVLQAQLEAFKRAAAFEDVMKSSTDALKSTIVDLATVVTDNLADAFTGVSSFQDAFAAIFAGVLSSVGGFLQQLGGQLVVYGLLNLAFTTLASNPLSAPAAIAVGIAAIAAGALFKSLSKQVTPSASSGGGSYSATSSSSSASSISNPAIKNSNLNINVTFDPIVLRADGEDLRAVSEVGAYRIKRRN